MTTGVEQTDVIIVGAGPSGLATAACLHKRSIPHIILEREDCIASTFNKKAYDRLHLHIHKKFCQLPHLPFPKDYPTYVPKLEFLKYLDNYSTHFGINPKFGNFVKLAKYDKDLEKWRVEAKVVGDPNGEDGDGGGVRWYEGRFLVIATGETSDAFVPDVDGLSEFKGEVIHSTRYKCGKGYEGKTVLVVGSGNSGMEIALDLSNYGAKTSIVVRSPIMILTRWLPAVGATLLKILPMNLVDSFMVLASKAIFGDLTKYGIQRTKEGPFLLAAKYGKFPVIDVGTCKKIRSREIQVLPALKSIRNGGNELVFDDEKCYQFDAIVFATGFKKSTHLWLQEDDDCLLNKDGQPKEAYPNHWKGEHGIYCVGFAKMGLAGSAVDAQNVADHIFNLILISNSK